jgi:hypothetical protein
LVQREGTGDCEHGNAKSDMPSWQVIGILGEEGDASAMRPARKDGDRAPRWRAQEPIMLPA